MLCKYVHQEPQSTTKRRQGRQEQGPEASSASLAPRASSYGATGRPTRPRACLHWYTARHCGTASAKGVSTQMFTMPKTAPAMCHASAAVTFVRGVGGFCCAQTHCHNSRDAAHASQVLSSGQVPVVSFLFALTPQPHFRDERPGPEMSPCPRTPPGDIL